MSNIPKTAMILYEGPLSEIPDRVVAGKEVSVQSAWRSSGGSGWLFIPLKGPADIWMFREVGTVWRFDRFPQRVYISHSENS